MKLTKEDLLKYDFKSLFEKLNYDYFEKGKYNLNIIGVRSNNFDKVTNFYDDYLVVIYNDSNNKPVRKVYTITTEPGMYYIKTHFTNPKGTAILVEGQYKGCYKLGYHNNSYKALVQCKPVKVYRDNNHDDIYDLDPNTIEKGNFGINIHRSDRNFVRRTVDKYSAGCQVFNDARDFDEFIYLCEKQSRIYGNSFTYTLIKETDL